MTDRATASGAAGVAEKESLEWENLGAHASGRAFRKSLGELLLRPGRFFRKMALRGGLHEPLTFFGILLGVLILLAFPAALSYFGLTAPDPAETPVEVYQLHTLPSRVTGVLLVLLPVAVVVGVAATALLGSLFHGPAKLFGARNWEGSVSVWAYSSAAALVPPVAVAALIFVVSLAGYLLALAWPGVREPAGDVARWVATAALPAGGLVGLVLLVRNTIKGCSQAFGLDGSPGVAAALSGLLLIAALTVACIAAYRQWGFAGGTIVLGGVLVVAGVPAVLHVTSRRTAGEE
jgi:hypothetical protein